MDDRKPANQPDRWPATRPASPAVNRPRPFTAGTATYGRPRNRSRRFPEAGSR